jgi:hypothetical protein
LSGCSGPGSWRVCSPSRSAIISAQADHRVIADLILVGDTAEDERRLGRRGHDGYQVFLASVTGARGAG